MPAGRGVSARHLAEDSYSRDTRSTALWGRFFLLVAFVIGAWLWHGWNGGLAAALGFFALYWLAQFAKGIRSGWRDGA